MDPIEKWKIYLQEKEREKREKEESDRLYQLEYQETEKKIEEVKKQIRIDFGDDGDRVIELMNIIIDFQYRDEEKKFKKIEKEAQQYRELLDDLEKMYAERLEIYQDIVDYNNYINNNNNNNNNSSS